MSIASLYSTGTKPYQTLNVGSVTTEEFLTDVLIMDNLTVGTLSVSGLNAQTFHTDATQQSFTWGSGTGALTRTYGVVHMTGIPVIHNDDGNSHTFVFTSSKIHSYSPVFLTFNMMNIVANSNVKYSLDTVSNGYFRIRITNFSGTSTTPTQFRMSYLFFG